MVGDYGDGMPMYLDRHVTPGATAQDIADAHMRDVEIQSKHGVHYHTYWFDAENETVFCLAEGPSQEAVEAVHSEAHGLTASSIMVLDSATSLNQILGSMPSFPTGVAYEAPAMRAILFTDICGSVAQVHKLGDVGHMELLKEHDDIVRSELSNHEGREVKHTGDGIMASFASITACVAFAIMVQKRLDDRNATAPNALDVSIGIGAGEPITDGNHDLFGAAVQMAARLCAAAGPNEITVSTAVRELCAGKQIGFEDRGELDLKGFPEPVRAYSVQWRD